MEHMKGIRMAVQEHYEFLLERMDKTTDPDFKTTQYHELNGFINGLFWCDFITTEAYHAMMNEVFEAWLKMA